MGAFLIEDPKCVFIHVPKTAGTTIRKGVFGEKYEGPVFFRIPEKWEEFFCFAFVRNPFDRLVSAWKMFSIGMQESKWALNNNPPLKGTNFTDFLKIATDESIDHHSRDTINSVIRHHTLPQTHHYHCIQYANFIGKYENFEKDLKHVTEKLKFRDYSVTHLNKTIRDSYKEYYCEKSYEIVSYFYQEDLDKFDYKF
ncbi:sulfotransferase family 2 domain-containing protein [Christiangramia echinicola]|uniref:Sulfotransferase family protein n=1 Tax=Christiangramia echinicola TaxID=279359 RepID=A0A1H1L5D1_9FLAO|nr:sulfotransferase family 2 domain-containing protein [Christiangramia echinicola]SDR69245.1 Sulfotransferase family protein [Christiangramia echinicola]